MEVYLFNQINILERIPEAHCEHKTVVWPGSRLNYRPIESFPSSKMQ